MAEDDADVPVYLPDRTIIGKAKITKTEEGMFATIKLSNDTVAELMSEDLIGLSVVYQSNDARDALAVSLESQEDLSANYDCLYPKCFNDQPHWHGVLCTETCFCTELLK